MKKQLATLLLAAALTLAALPAAAQENDPAVTLQKNGSRTAVTLTLPEQAAQQVTSLQMSFTVEGAAVTFAFADNLPATVQEYRYQDGRLQLYLSGRTALLDGNGSVRLGEIRLADGQDAEATVTFDPDSLTLVNAAYGDAQAPELQPVSAQLTASGSAGSGTGGGQTGGSGNAGSTGGSPAATQAPQSTAQPGTGAASAPAASAAGDTAGTAPEPDSAGSMAPETPEATASAQPTAAPDRAETQQAADGGLPVLLLAVIGGVMLALAAGLIVYRLRR